MSGGRPPFEATAQQRNQVTMLAACGTRHEIIARHFGIDRKTLRKHFKAELKEGRVDANALVAKSLFASAINGNIVAQIFWLKTRANWKETSTHELTGNAFAALDIGISFANGGPGRPRVESAIPGSDIDGVFVTPPAEEIDAIPHEARALSAPREPDESKPKESAAALQWAALAADDETPK
jgi:hypothetical protein